MRPPFTTGGGANRKGKYISRNSHYRNASLFHRIICRKALARNEIGPYDGTQPGVAHFTLAASVELA